MYRSNLDYILPSSSAELTSDKYSFDPLVLTIDNYHLLIELFSKFINSFVCLHFKSPQVYNLKNSDFNDIVIFISNNDFELNLNNNLSLLT